MLDIRKILGLTFLYSCFVGVFMIIFGFFRKQSKGLKTMGSGILTYGLGFFFIATRDYLPDFVSIIISNYLSFLEWP
ncbi:hypothetical protein Q5O14_17555 [Eubacteriaceae bacterium ES2]|nr:hypothetical protein Q5O14_17555 [Eubacteriaceae bacterium ES2]